MDNFLKIPQELYARCIAHGKLSQKGSNLYCFEADIHTISNIFQTDDFERPDYLKQAKQQRLNEFYAGRIATEAILVEVLNCRQPITSMTATLPIWPQGVKGSISHAKNKLLVVISTQVEYLGVDVEYIMPADVAEKMADLILTRPEQDLYISEGMQYLSFAEYLTLLFSLKESLYKAIYPQTQHYIDFLQAQLIDINLQHKTAIFQLSAEIKQHYHLRESYHAVWELHADHVVTRCCP